MGLFRYFRQSWQTIRVLTQEYEEKYTNYLVRKYENTPCDIVVKTVVEGDSSYLDLSRVKGRHLKVFTKSIQRRRFSPWEFLGWDAADEKFAEQLQREYEVERRRRLREL